MPRRNSLTRRLLLFGRGWDEWDRTPLKQQPEQAAPKQKSGRRFATTLSFCALFFAGLALSAGIAQGRIDPMSNQNAVAAMSPDTVAVVTGGGTVTVTEGTTNVIASFGLNTRRPDGFET